MDNNINLISDYNKTVREKANRISIEFKPELDVAINSYLECYNMYIRENVCFTMRYGRVWNPKCTKYDFEG